METSASNYSKIYFIKLNIMLFFLWGICLWQLIFAMYDKTKNYKKFNLAEKNCTVSNNFCYTCKKYNVSCNVLLLLLGELASYL